MELKQKMKIIEVQNGLNQKGLAELLGLNHEVFNKNIARNKITTDMVHAFADKLPEVDLNWLIKNQGNTDIPSEVSEDNIKSPEKELEKAIKILEAVRSKIAREGHVEK